MKQAFRSLTPLWGAEELESSFQMGVLRGGHPEGCGSSTSRGASDVGGPETLGGGEASWPFPAHLGLQPGPPMPRAGPPTPCRLYPVSAGPPGATCLPLPVLGGPPGAPQVTAHPGEPPGGYAGNPICPGADGGPRFVGPRPAQGCDGGRAAGCEQSPRGEGGRMRQRRLLGSQKRGQGAGRAGQLFPIVQHRSQTQHVPGREALPRWLCSPPPAHAGPAWPPVPPPPVPYCAALPLGPLPHAASTPSCPHRSLFTCAATLCPRTCFPFCLWTTGPGDQEWGGSPHIPGPGRAGALGSSWGAGRWRAAPGGLEESLQAQLYLHHGLGSRLGGAGGGGSAPGDLWTCPRTATSGPRCDGMSWGLPGTTWSRMHSPAVNGGVRGLSQGQNEPGLQFVLGQAKNRSMSASRVSDPSRSTAGCHLGDCRVSGSAPDVSHWPHVNAGRQ